MMAERLARPPARAYQVPEHLTGLVDMLLDRLVASVLREAHEQPQKTPHDRHASAPYPDPEVGTR